MLVGILLIAVGLMSAIVNVCRGDGCAGRANFAGVIWHLSFAIMGAFTAVLGFNLMGFK